MFDLALSDEQEELQKAYRSLLERECSTEVVRASEATGYADGLWRRMVELGVQDMAVPARLGGAAADFADLVLVNQLLGEALAPVPVPETMAAIRLLGALDSPAATELIEASLGSGRPLTLTPRQMVGDDLAWVPAGAVAEVVMATDGERVVAVSGDEPLPSPGNLGSLPVAHRRATGTALELARGPGAMAVFTAAVREWRGLVAAQASGAARRALQIGVAYTTERQAFGVPIASFQSIAHRLADAAAMVDGAELLVQKAAWAVDAGDPRSPALLQMAFCASLDAADRAVDDALHFHGGYGFMLEYDIQLYFRRVKAWSLQDGDRSRALEHVADLLWGPPGPLR